MERFKSQFNNLTGAAALAIVNLHIVFAYDSNQVATPMKR